MSSPGGSGRLAIARSLAVQPQCLVADEPNSTPDVSIRAGILKLMNALKGEFQLSFLYITHDLATARYLGERIMVLYAGNVMGTALWPDLVRSPHHPYTRLLLAATPGSSSPTMLPEKSQEQQI